MVILCSLPPPCILIIFAILDYSEEVDASLIDIIIETLILQASSVGGQLILLITWETGTIRLQSAAETIFNKHVIKKIQDCF